MKSPCRSIKIRVYLSDDFRLFLVPILSVKGKLKPLYAVVHRNPEHRPEGSYFLLRYASANGKRVWASVGRVIACARRAAEEGEDSRSLSCGGSAR